MDRQYDFNRVQFEAVKNEAGLNRFVMISTKWIEQMNSIGIVSKSGRYGVGTYAHSDIAMSFATWISPEFQLYIMMANMESYNAILIDQGKTMSERLVLLRELAVKQTETLSVVSMDAIKRLPGDES